MTQRQITQPVPTVHASSSSSALFLGRAPARRSGLLHIPPPPIAERFPEVAPSLRDTAVLGVLGAALALLWFILTPAGPPPLW